MESEDKMINKGERNSKGAADKDAYDPMGKAKEVIRESLVLNTTTTTTPPNKQEDETSHVAQHSDDILAFSRSVNTTDSSLH